MQLDIFSSFGEQVLLLNGFAVNFHTVSHCLHWLHAVRHILSLQHLALHQKLVLLLHISQGISRLSFRVFRHVFVPVHGFRVLYHFMHLLFGLSHFAQFIAYTLQLRVDVTCSNLLGFSLETLLVEALLSIRLRDVAEQVAVVLADHADHLHVLEGGVVHRALY